jgi:hypothetical protein
VIEANELILPPRLRNHEGGPRRVGVEIEFAALTADVGAREVHALFGGTVERRDEHRYLVADTSLGDFTCELDTQYAHRATDREGPAEGKKTALDSLLGGFQDKLRSFYGDVGSLLIPCEIACPPVAIEDLARIESLVQVLKEAGATGTRASPFYGFGAQLNPEIAEGGLEWMTSMLKAYLLLSDWLRAVMRIDLTRRIVAFATPFPTSYAEMVVDPGYWPDQDRLIGDYLASNPTRNRELDLLPLFKWLDPERVQAAVPDRKVSPRPALHYRLPDANFGEPGWGLHLEWNRWSAVERLAERRGLLDPMGAAYRENRARLFPENWAISATEWIMAS